MPFSIRAGAALGAGLFLGLTAFAGCAQSEPVDLSAGGDPSLPGVDGSWNPAPGKGPKPGESESEDEDAGSTQPKPDAKADAKADAKEPPAQGSKPSQGEVLITEVMYDTSGTEPATEWIEVHNTASGARTLSGLTISDGSNRTHTIGTGVTIASGAYVLLVRDESVAIGAKVPSAAIAYEYGAGQTSSTGVQLANGATGAVSLKDGSTILAQAKYGGWFGGGGAASVQLKTLTYAAGSSKSEWCLSASSWTTGSDKGTPGAADDCP